MLPDSVINSISAIGSMLDIIKSSSDYAQDSIAARHKKAIDELVTDTNNVYTIQQNELEMLMKHYVCRTYRLLAVKNGQIKGERAYTNTDRLAKNIHKSQKKIIIILGEAGSGKSTAMRHLFYALSGWQGPSKNLFISLTKAKSFKDTMSDYKSSEKMDRLGKTEIGGVNLFLDAFDEAGDIYSGSMNAEQLLEEIGQKLFSPNIDYNAVSNRLNNLIISARPGLFADGFNTLRNSLSGGLSMEIYELMPMDEKQVKKTFCVMKKINRKNRERYDVVQDGTLSGEAQFGAVTGGSLMNARLRNKDWRHLKNKLKKYLKTEHSDDGSLILGYPVFMRYAHMFLYDYNEKSVEAKRRNRDGEDGATKSRKDAYQSLIEGMIKWEFHVWLGRKKVDDAYFTRKEKYIEYGIYRDTALNFLDNIVQKMCEHVLNGEEAYISWNEIAEIWGKTDDSTYIKVEQSPIRHLLVTGESDGKNRIFYFCHESFFEFLTAKHLSGQKADYKLRRNILKKWKAPELRAFYYLFLCESRDLYSNSGNQLYNRLAKSLKGCDTLNLKFCMEMEQKENAEIVDSPELSLAEIFEFFPLIKGMKFQMEEFTATELENILDQGTVDLSNRQLLPLSAVSNILPLYRIYNLNLCGRDFSRSDLTSWGQEAEVTDVFSPLSNMKNLKKVDIRGTVAWEKAMISLSEGSADLDEVAVAIEAGETEYKEALKTCKASRVRVDVEEYSPVYVDLWEIYSDDINGNIQPNVQPYRRTSLESAKRKYKETIEEDKISLLSAVYYLEINCKNLGDEDKDNADWDATLWNGLTLAHALSERDYMDEDQQENMVLSQLRPYLDERKDNLGVTFCRLYGTYLAHMEKTEESIPYLLYAYENHDEGESTVRNSYYGSWLYRAYVRLRDYEAAKKLGNELEELAGQTGENLYSYYHYKIVLQIKEKKYSEAEKTLSQARRIIINPTKSTTFTFLYLNAVIYNQMGKFDEAEKICDEMLKYLKTAKETKRNEQSKWYEYYEPKLVSCWGLGKRDEARKIAEKIVQYPYWPTSVSKEYSRIICDKCKEKIPSQESEDYNICRKQVEKIKDLVWY